MKLIRYIHPIGQGAFYTEQFFDDDNNKIATVVFDCGSLTNKAGLEREIRGTFEQDDEIDFLFLSHFHEDHINGIDELKKRTHIKTVVIPLYNDYDRLLYLGAITANNDSAYNKLANLIIDPMKYFNNEGNSQNNKGEKHETRVIFIKPMEKDAVENSSVVGESCSESGTALPVPKSISAWEYVPFHHYDSAQFGTFHSECSKLQISDINQFISYRNNRDKLKAIYKRVFKNGSINESSLIVYSGLKAQNDKIGNDSQTPNACLYTGDATFNPAVISKLQSDLVDKIPKIIMFQIPHHASKHSFDEKILDLLRHTSKSLVAFTSCGNNNSFGHPSPYVITQCNLLLREHSISTIPLAHGIDYITNQSVRIVTESKDSMLALQYDLNNRQ